MNAKKYETLKRECDGALRAIPKHGLEHFYPKGVEVWSHPYEWGGKTLETVYNIDIAGVGSMQSQISLDHVLNVAEAVRMVSAIFEGFRNSK
jgi:hypothetical protein